MAAVGCSPAPETAVFKLDCVPVFELDPGVDDAMRVAGSEVVKGWVLTPCLKDSLA